MSANQEYKGKSKYWCFTTNNYDEKHEDHLQSLPCSYIIYGRERGEQGTPHLQGYIQFAARKSLRQARLLVPGSHLSVARGTPQENKNYCSKEGDVYERGEMQTSGRRNDLEEIKSQIDSGASNIEIAEQHFSQWCVYRRSFAEYRTLRMPAADRDVRVVVIWGPTGTGKSATARAGYPDAYFHSDPTLRWWQGYQGEDTVILDEFAGASACERSTLLRVLDRYAYHAPTKGGSVVLRATKIIITSNFPPEAWGYEQNDAVLRRIHCSLNFTQPLNYSGRDSLGELLEQLFRAFSVEGDQ